jgi:predicted small secreted protein
MKKRLVMFIAAAVVSVLLLAGCATVQGTVAGAGIGYMMGDAEFGARVGFTAGAIHDIFGY